ncbi:MAG: 3',5'-cyclic-nucleotide phosphodiesterase [Betaproteobacteria bacterium]|nr:3',5'-cyclic-nucleotide phosphodiesterase [Betaproteobacteria bacterium]
MKLRILGCSGGISGDLRTTSMLLDHDVLVDAGTGVGNLSIDELSCIDHVFVTHSHLDHVTSIPFLVDTVGWIRGKPITVHAIEPTLEILRQHLFNWRLWPDFTQIPDAQKPFLRYQAVALGKTVDLNGRRLTPLPANHVVPAIGYRLDSGRASLVFTGDTTTNDPLWQEVNQINNLRYLIIETAFCNREKDLAIASKHLCPSMLAEELAKFKRKAEVYITHLKPGEIELTMREIQECAGAWKPRMLENNQVFEL